ASHVLFTSGTTGRPAAVAVPPGALAGTLGWYVDTFLPSGRDRVALLAGLGHDPVLRDMLVPLMAGGTLVVPPDDVFASPERLSTFVREARVTILHATPALLGLLVAGGSGSPAQPAAGLADLRLVVCGGAPLTARLVRALRRLTPARVVNAYGTTETPQVASCQVAAGAGEPVPASVPDRATLPVGSGAGGAELVVVDAAGAPAGVGQLGEVVVCSPHLALGYAGDTGDAGRFVPDPGGRPGYRAYRTGDLGRRDPWGGVHLDGRLDRQVLVDGFRVAPEQVEAAALGLPYVEDALVTLRPTPAGEVLALQVVAAATAGQPSAGDVRARLRAVLPPYAVPADIRVVPRLGTDHNHKVAAAPDDLTSPPRLSGGLGGSDGDGAPDTVVAELSRLVREVIGRDLPQHENFLDGGLSSVGLVRLHALLSQRLAVDLPVTALFAHPNLAALARFLAHRGAGEDPRGPEPAPTGDRETVPAGARDTGARDAAAAGPDPAQQRRQLRQRLYSDLGEAP
ncbi:MAG TPA: non-ribosomal peptide synthetase, partial [Micromonosporaceae bacterium]|nr:non-ribosomal peptide synthetase [Micromonosporaceae bacterium]